MALTDEQTTGLQLGGIFTLFIALFLVTIATAANSWQTTSSRNYYFNIGIWKWCAISKTNDNSTVCGSIDKKQLYSKEEEQNAVTAVRYLTCFTCSMVALSMLFMLGDTSSFAWLAGFTALIGMILGVITISIYSKYVWENADLDNSMENISPNDPNWKYGFSYWFFVTEIVLTGIAVIILLILAAKMPKNGRKSDYVPIDSGNKSDFQQASQGDLIVGNDIESPVVPGFDQ
jgi:hypothetical protein